MIAEDLVYAPADRLLGRSVAGTLGIGGVAHKSQNALCAQFREALQVDGVAVDRCVVDLEITGVDDGSRGGSDRQRRGVHYTVVGLNELDVKFAQCHNIAEGHDMELCGLQQVVFA